MAFRRGFKEVRNSALWRMIAIVFAQTITALKKRYPLAHQVNTDQLLLCEGCAAPNRCDCTKIQTWGGTEPQNRAPLLVSNFLANQPDFCDISNYRQLLQDVESLDSKFQPCWSKLRTLLYNRRRLDDGDDTVLWSKKKNEKVPPKNSETRKTSSALVLRPPSSSFLLFLQQSIQSSFSIQEPYPAKAFALSSSYSFIMSASSTENTNDTHGSNDEGAATNTTPGGDEDDSEIVVRVDTDYNYDMTLDAAEIQNIISDIISDDQLIVLASMEMLDTLVFRGNKNHGEMCKVVHEAIGAAVLCSALEKWIGDADIVTGILGVLLDVSGHRFQGFDCAMLSTGLLEATVAAMREHTQDKYLLVVGIGFLRNAATSADNAKYLVEKLGAHEDILGAIAAFPDDKVMQRDGSEALRSLLEPRSGVHGPGRCSRNDLPRHSGIQELRSENAGY